MQNTCTIACYPTTVVINTPRPGWMDDVSVRVSLPAAEEGGAPGPGARESIYSRQAAQQPLLEGPLIPNTEYRIRVEGKASGFFGGGRSEVFFEGLVSTRPSYETDTPDLVPVLQALHKCSTEGPLPVVTMSKNRATAERLAEGMQQRSNEMWLLYRGSFGDEGSTTQAQQQVSRLPLSFNIRLDSADAFLNLLFDGVPGHQDTSRVRDMVHCAIYVFDRQSSVGDDDVHCYKLVCETARSLDIDLVTVLIDDPPQHRVSPTRRPHESDPACVREVKMWQRREEIAEKLNVPSSSIMLCYTHQEKNGNYDESSATVILKHLVMACRRSLVHQEQLKHNASIRPSLPTTQPTTVNGASEATGTITDSIEEHRGSEEEGNLEEGKPLYPDLSILRSTPPSGHHDNGSIIALPGKRKRDADHHMGSQEQTPCQAIVEMVGKCLARRRALRRSKKAKHHHHHHHADANVPPPRDVLPRASSYSDILSFCL